MEKDKFTKSRLAHNPTDTTSRASLRDTTRKLAINVTPTEPPSLKASFAGWRTAGFRTVVDIGIDNLSIEYPAESVGFYLHSKGVSANDLNDKVRTSELLTEPQKQSLIKSTGVMSALEEAEPRRSRLLQTAANVPVIEIVEFLEVEQPGIEQIILAPEKQTVNLSIVELQAQISQNPVISFARNYAQDIAKKRLVDIAEKAGKKVGKKLLEKKLAQEVVKAGTKIAAKFAIGEAISDVIAAIGAASGPLAPLVIPLLKALGMLLSEVIMWIASKLKKYAKEIAAAGITLLAAGILFGSMPALLLGLAGIGVGGLSGGLPGAAVSFVATAATLIATLVSTFITALLSAIATSFFTFLFFTVFAVLVINQGAYVVPYNPDALDPTQLAPMESKYIKVTKTAKSSKPKREEDSYQEYKNNEVPSSGLVITYTITITPRLGSLTDISFSSQCNVTKENASPPCPEEENITVSPPPLVTPTASPPPLSFPPTPPNLISPSSPYVITYTQTFDRATYEDSIIVDTFLVTATASDGETSTASGIATVVIGEPPMDCPGVWPVRLDIGRTYYITQGPNTRHTHKGPYANAVDVSSLTSHNAHLDEIIATHRGTIDKRGVDQWGGLYIEIKGFCEQKQFVSRHVHFDSFDPNVTIGTNVIRGTTLGIMGSTGYANHRHDHYQFVGIRMGRPYIPEEVRQGCVGKDECNIQIP